MLNLKMVNISITDAYENSLATELYELLKPDYLVSVMKEKYATIDIDIKNILTNQKMFLELKYRSSLNYPTYFIGLAKLHNIEKYYKNTVLVWRSKNDLVFIQYDKAFLSYNQLFINGGLVIEIKKQDCEVGLGNLVEHIKRSI